MSEKKTLSTEEIEAQSVLELPDREVLNGGTFSGTFINAAVATNYCPATTAFASNASATTYCTAVAIATQKVG